MSDEHPSTLLMQRPPTHDTDPSHDRVTSAHAAPVNNHQSVASRVSHAPPDRGARTLIRRWRPVSDFATVLALSAGFAVLIAWRSSSLNNGALISALVFLLVLSVYRTLLGAQRDERANDEEAARATPDDATASPACSHGWSRSSPPT